MSRYRTRSWRAFDPAAAGVTASGPADDVRILGLDPGSRRTGFGVIDCRGSVLVVCAHGCLNVGTASAAVRLRMLFEGLRGPHGEHRPRRLRRARVRQPQRRQRAQARSGARRGAVRGAGRYPGVRVRAAGHQAGAGRLGRRGEVPGGTHGAGAARRRRAPVGGRRGRARGRRLPRAYAAHRRAGARSRASGRVRQARR